MIQFSLSDYVLFRVNAIRFTITPAGPDFWARLGARAGELQLRKIYAAQYLGGKN